MEKYYCDHCRLLYTEEVLCKVCDTLVKKKIIIEVQEQKNSNHLTERE